MIKYLQGKELSVYLTPTTMAISLHRSSDSSEENLTSPLDINRFLDLISKCMKPESRDRQLRKVFKVLDKDSIRFISINELRHILTSVDEKLDPTEFDD
ncbi:hypothetical protein RYX36_001964 [Vicia faba]